MAVDSGFFELVIQTLQRAIEGLNRLADPIDLRRARVRSRCFNASDARFERRQCAGEGAGVGFRFKRAEALSNILLRLTHVGEIDAAARTAGDVFNLLDACRERELRIAQIRNRSARRLAEASRAFAGASFSPLDAANQRCLFSLQRIDSANALRNLALKAHDFFEQCFTRTARLARRFSAHFSNSALDRTARRGFAIAKAFAQLFLQTAQLSDRVDRSFRRLTCSLLSNSARFRERLRQNVAAIAHLVRQERGGSLSAARNFFGDSHLVLKPMLDVFDIGRAAAQRFAGGAELFQRV
ncbi:MAG: hypothetical protein IPG56_20220 [Caulobacteraceae bacterium]|nr:hypothetical protein [Caulobacteraceae bacterium]